MIKAYLRLYYISPRKPELRGQRYLYIGYIYICVCVCDGVCVCLSASGTDDINPFLHSVA